MNPSQIADKINRLTLKNGSQLAHLQETRADIKGLKRLPKQVFSSKTIFDNYAYHHGGRKEIQFNFGEENWNGKSIVRFGLSISFEASRDLPNPVAEMAPRVNAFNAYLQDKGESKLQNLKMWNSETGINTDFSPLEIGQIPGEWIKLGSFIHIGSFFEKSLSEITDEDILTMISVFDQLFPVYEFIESNLIEERYARVCWNTNDWRSPSGPTGKSMDKSSYEYQTGFGHEEWLFDFEKLIDGQHYGYLRPIDTHRKTYEGSTFNVTLFTRNEEDNREYLVGKIQNLKVISIEESIATFEEYKKRGWVEQIKKQLKSVDAKLEFQNKSVLTGESFFNVKFYPEDVIFFDNFPVPFRNQPSNVKKATRYTFLHKNEVRIDDQKQPAVLIFSPNLPPDPSKQDATITKTFSKEQVEYQNIHANLQIGFHHYLNKKYPNKTQREAKTGNGKASIDLKFENKDGSYTLFEVKSYQSLRHSLRVALGQLMEYAYFPQKIEAKELVVISFQKAGADIESYLLHLSKQFGIPIGYIQFDTKRKKVLQYINCFKY